jgi:hypothetical protein
MDISNNLSPTGRYLRRTLPSSGKYFHESYRISLNFQKNCINFYCRILSLKSLLEVPRKIWIYQIISLRQGGIIRREADNVLDFSFH